MRKTTLLLLSSISCLYASFSAFAATPVCYSWDVFPNERTVITIEPGNPLISPLQNAFNLNGMDVSVCGLGTAAPSNGTIVTSTTPGASGSRLGYRISTIDALRGCAPVNLDCSSTQTTVPQNQWTCQVQNQRGIFFATLTRVVGADPLCSAYSNIGLEEVHDPDKNNYGPGNAPAKPTDQLENHPEING